MPGIKKYSLQYLRNEVGGRLGARKGDTLIAISPTYKGIRIQIDQDQDTPRAYARFVTGTFTIIDAGKGKYQPFFEKLVGKNMNSGSLTKEINRLERCAGKKPQYKFGTEQNMMGIQCPGCGGVQTSLDSCECEYVREL